MKKVILTICFIIISIIAFSVPITIRWSTPNGCEYILHVDVFYNGHGGYNGWHGEGTIIGLTNSPGCFYGIGSIVFKPDNTGSGDIEMEFEVEDICDATCLKFVSKNINVDLVVSFLNSVSSQILHEIKQVIRCN